MLHWPWLYRRVHRIHHGHWFESAFQGAGFLLPLLLGVGMKWQVVWPEWLLALLFMNARGMARHDARLVGWIGDHRIVHHRNPTVNYEEEWLEWLLGHIARGLA
jgi:hypothetical protein